MKQRHLPSKKKFDTALEAAIAYLIGMGIVKKDGEVAIETKTEKGNFSSYKNGKLTPSKNFVVEFEKIYGLRLQDFNPDVYDPLTYIIEKSGPSTVPDRSLLTQMKQQLEDLNVSFSKLSEGAGLGQTAHPQGEPFETLKRGKTQKAGKRSDTSK